MVDVVGGIVNGCSVDWTAAWSRTGELVEVGLQCPVNGGIPASSGGGTLRTCRCSRRWWWRRWRCRVG